MYSNSYSTCSFEAEIIKIGQSSHKMYSNNIQNCHVYIYIYIYIICICQLQKVMCTYIYIYIYVCVCVCVFVCVCECVKFWILHCL